MLHRIAARMIPAPLRQWLQYRKLAKLVAKFEQRVVEHCYGGIPLRVLLADPLAEGWYDHDWPSLPELAILKGGRLRAGARVFDIGAHQGVVGLMLGVLVGPSGQVILVEPSPHNIAVCQRNVELNDMPWVVARKAAVSDCLGRLRFNLGLNGSAAEVSDYAGTFECSCVTIDSLTEEYGSPDVLVIDVEGLECKVLLGAQNTRSAPADWMVEVHVGCGLEAAGGTASQVLEFFSPSDYDLYVHSEGDRQPVPFDSATPAKLKNRFFLTAICKDRG